MAMAPRSTASYVKPAIVDLEKVAAHYSISSLFAPYGERTDIFSYTVNRLDYHTNDAGKMRMALGKARFTSKMTQESEISLFGLSTLAITMSPVACRHRSVRMTAIGPSR